MQTCSAKEITITRISLIFTLGILVAIVRFFVMQAVIGVQGRDCRLAAQASVFGAAVLFLIYGNLVYQFCRLGYYQRRQDHKAAEPLPQDGCSDRVPSLTILIPSYKEERNIIWQTMVSAALAEYPEKAVVLLIDDPFHPKSREGKQQLEQARSIPAELRELFSKHRETYQSELANFRKRVQFDGAAELERLVMLHQEVSEWWQSLRQRYIGQCEDQSLTHADKFFVEQILEVPARRHAAFARELTDKIHRNEAPDREYLERRYARLAALFNVQFSSFQRKAYRNLSHEQNKAMNLNSYFGLMGNAWRAVPTAAGPVLEKVPAETADFIVPATDYIIVLDADSLLLPDYVQRLIAVIERPENRRVAVIQTPYSAFPESPNLLQRIAGATTDLAYIIHQGFTRWNATFWVGANAMIRREALEDIKHTRIENGFPVAVYIRDRTVIEDVDSSIDLLNRGWSLCNYPERLAFSATPPDGGALLIQRRRWASGHLLILRKLLQYAAGKAKPVKGLKEFFLRLNYFSSSARDSVVMLVLLFYPFGNDPGILWALFAVLPYVVLSARDLRMNGNKYSDVFRIYALHLMLIPVVLGGFLNSVRQCVTGAKIPFGRTPKVSGRTPMPPLYSLLELAFPLALAVALLWDLHSHRWLHALFSAMNCGFLLHALSRMLGIKEALADAFAPLIKAAAKMGQPAEPMWVDQLAGTDKEVHPEKELML